MIPNNNWSAMSFMKLKLVAAISALVAIPALTHAQQGGPPPSVPKPTKADVEKVVQIVTSDEAKTQGHGIYLPTFRAR